MTHYRFVILEADGVTIRNVGWTDNPDNIAIQPLPSGGSLVQLAPGDPDVSSTANQYDPGTSAFIARVIPLAEAKATKVVLLQASCDAVIIGGFSSSALGSAHDYPSLISPDQANMNRVAMAGGDLWCAVSGTWSMQTHTAAQGLTVLTDFGTYCDTQRSHLASLTTSVNSAPDAATVNAITW